MSDANPYQSLLPPNASQLEQDMERISAELLQPVDFDCRTLWSAEDCPLHLLPYLASALGADDWDDDWPEYIQRENVARAVELQSTKGTIYAIKRAASNFGVTTTVREYRDNPDTLAPCQVQITAVGGTASIQAAMERAVAKAVRASDSFELINGTYGASRLNIVGVGRCITVQRFDCPTDYTAP